MTRKLTAFLGALFVMFSPALAQTATPLTADEATRFVASLEETHAFGDALEKSGRADTLDIGAPRPGEGFKPYSSAVKALKEQQPADHARLAAIVKPHGFTAESWGAVGDKVVIAYLAEKMERENPDAMKEMQAMDPAMLEQVPPEMKAQILGAMALVEAANNAPENDRETVRPLMDELDAVMDAEQRGRE